MVSVTPSVHLEKLDPTLDEMQEYIDQAKALGISGSEKIAVVGRSEGYHFAGTYKFTPTGLRVRGKAAPDLVDILGPDADTDPDAMRLAALEDLLERIADLSRRDTDPVELITGILGDASEATCDPDRARDIATRAVAEACDNREGK